MDESLVAACGEPVPDGPAARVEAELVSAAWRLLHEYEAEGITSAGIADLEQALQALRRYEHEVGA